MMLHKEIQDTRLTKTPKNCHNRLWCFTNRSTTQDSPRHQKTVTTGYDASQTDPRHKTYQDIIKLWQQAMMLHKQVHDTRLTKTPKNCHNRLWYFTKRSTTHDLPRHHKTVTTGYDASQTDPQYKIYQDITKLWQQAMMLHKQIHNTRLIKISQNCDNRLWCFTNRSTIQDLSRYHKTVTTGYDASQTDPRHKTYQDLTKLWQQAMMLHKQIQDTIDVPPGWPVRGHKIQNSISGKEA